jgi:2-oxo-3-hexenedioate decarboxylase/2-keto-4-pentenoate hydratase
MLQDFAPTTIEDAYEVQDAFLGMLGQGKGPLGGYKIAYTSDEMRRLRGIRSPCAGGIFAATIQDSPATFHGTDYVRLAIECEVAARMGTDVPASKAPYSRASIADYIECIAAAFEMVDLRGAAAGTGKDAAAIAGICTNISNPGVMVIDGAEVGKGRGSDVMGHPLAPLVWLANMLAERGKELKAGTIVITGSIIPPQPLRAGDTATISIGGLGEAHVTVL